MPELINENKEIFEELRKTILGGKCIAFIGSGLSMGSYDPWHKLIKKICENCGTNNSVDKGSSPEQLLNAAQEAKSYDPNAYFRTLGEHFGNFNLQQHIYNVILQLPFQCYMTTNFDSTLAKNAGLARERCQLPPKVYPTGLDRRDVRNRHIFYLHGLIKEGEIPKDGDIVLSKDEFDHAYQDNSRLMSLLTQTFEEDPIIFIGCRLKEPPLEKVFKISNRNRSARMKKIEETGESDINPPPRLILLSKPEIGKNVQTSADQRTAMEKAERFYGKLSITVVWYDAQRNDHSVLRRTLESLAELPDITPKHFWGGEENDI